MRVTTYRVLDGLLVIISQGPCRRLPKRRSRSSRGQSATEWRKALAARTVPVEGPGWPPPESFEVARCLRIVLNEEWHHRLFAERDLDALEAGGSYT